MLKNLVIKPLKDGLYEGIGFEGKPHKIKKFEYYPALTLQELKNKRIYLILKPTHFFFENYTISLPVYSPEIVRLKLQDRVNTLGYFTKPVNIYWKVVEKRDSFYKLAYLALESELIDAEIAKLKNLGNARLEVVTFLPFVLAKTISKEHGDKILIHREREGLWILIISNGNVYFIEFFPVDEFLGINVDELKGRLSFLQNFYYRESQRNLETIFLTREELLEVVKDLNYQVRVIEGDYQEFLNVFQVDSEYNFLPAEERAIKEVLEFNYRASIVMFILSLLLIASAVGLYVINREIEREIRQKEVHINESLQKLFAQYPENMLKNLRSYLEERIKLQQSPEPESLLITIVETFRGTKITDLEIRKEGDVYLLNLKGEKSLPEQEVTTFVSELLLKVDSFALVSESNIDYSVLDNKINFEIKGKLRSP